jgi:membrane fusion protein (multidrug efflux system)
MPRWHRRVGTMIERAQPHRRTAAQLLLWLTLALTACGKSGANGQATAETRSAGGARPPVPVEVALARTQRVEDFITGSGQIEPLQSIELRPEVEGRIIEILFREGSRVAAGDSLFKVDDSELKVLIVRAEADRDLANQTLARQRQLMESNSSTTSDLERADAAASAAQATLDLLHLRLSRTVVRAPFGGVTGARTASLGDYVSNQTRLVTLQTVNPQHASLDVPERYAEQLRNGLTVTFKVAALRSREFAGIVDFVDPVVRLPGRTIRIKARVANPRGELSAGMFAEGRLIAAARDNAVVVPEDAILPVQGNTLVFVVSDGKARRRPVEIGLRLPGFVEITSGVVAGEQVVVGGLERLTDGAPVKTTVVERR